MHATRHPDSRTFTRRMWASTAAVVATLAVGLAPALPTATAATAAASKTKKHAKHPKCKKGFVERHGRCVTEEQTCYHGVWSQKSHKCVEALVDLHRLAPRTF